MINNTLTFPLSQVDDILEDKKKIKPKTARHKGRTDDELFGNTDDVFGDIPAAKPKAGKKKKKITSAAAGKAKEDVDGAVVTGDSSAGATGESQGKL